MRFSRRERTLIKRLQVLEGDYFTFEKLTVNCENKRRAKYFRQSLLIGIRKLMKKLDAMGIEFKRVTPIGRGHRSLFRVSDKIHEI